MSREHKGATDQLKSLHEHKLAAKSLQIATIECNHKTRLGESQLKADELNLTKTNQLSTIKNLNEEITQLKSISKELSQVKFQKYKSDLQIEAQRVFSFLSRSKYTWYVENILRLTNMIIAL